MASRRVTQNEPKRTRRPPATTPEARENQLIAKAVDLAERQLEDGTASAQVISHYLKLGSSREKLEQERISREVDLLRIKKEQIESEKRVEELYSEALRAMRNYAGQPELEEEQEFYD